jgi:hypothetical protein
VNDEEIKAYVNSLSFENIDYKSFLDIKNKFLEKYKKEYKKFLENRGRE